MQEVIIYLRDSDKSQYFATTEFNNNCFNSKSLCGGSNIFREGGILGMSKVSFAVRQRLYHMRMLRLLVVGSY